MNPHVKSIDIDLFDGILRGSIDFTEGLNILSGENGTCKTQVLREIKAGKNIQSSNASALRIQAFSPKRNSERKNIERILQEIRNRRIDDYLQQLTKAVFQDNTFVDYAPFGEVYFLVYEGECKDGGDQKERMEKVTDDFNKVISRIFENYVLVSDWDGNRGSPNIRLRKNDNELSIESLSLGEQEIMSLIINLYASREVHDVFIIDEPEIHLNWHLEEKLFQFLDWFCNEYKKQVIVATHSRVVFTSNFISKTQFFYWENGHIIVGKNIPDEIRTRIAGESIDIIKVGSFPKVTFLVEDDMQVEVIQAIAEILKCDVACQSLGNRNNVRSMYKYSLLEGKWANCFFVEDGDNEGNPFSGEAKFIHLDKYCVENYLLDVSTAAKVVNQSEDFIRNAILNAIKENKSPMVKRNKFFNFFTSMLDSLTISNIDESSISVLDGSTIYGSFIRKLNIASNDYMEKYLQILYDEKRLEVVFPKQLISAINSTV